MRRKACKTSHSRLCSSIYITYEVPVKSQWPGRSYRVVSGLMEAPEMPASTVGFGPNRGYTWAYIRRCMDTRWTLTVQHLDLVLEMASGGFLGSFRGHKGRPGGRESHGGSCKINWESYVLPSLTLPPQFSLCLIVDHSRILLIRWVT